MALNEWKKKCVGLPRTWVSKRTVYHALCPLCVWKSKRLKKLGALEGAISINGEKGLCLVKPKPIRFLTIIPYTFLDSMPLHHLSGMWYLTLCCCCWGMVSRAHPKFTWTHNITPPTACDINGAAWWQCRLRCYPYWAWEQKPDWMVDTSIPPRTQNA